MKLALIPPQGLEERMWEGECLLALAHRLRYKPYLDTVQAIAEAGRHTPVMIDNGIAEGVTLHPIELNALAELCTAHELVLPDVLYGTNETLEAVKSYCKQYSMKGKRFFAVAQGRNLEDFKHCISEYVEMHKIKTIGLPRLILDKCGKSGRIDLATWMAYEFPDHRFSIHFLGTNPVWMREMYYVAKYCPNVRSIDTSMAYNYAAAGLDLSKKSTWEKVVKRPTGYFAGDWSKVLFKELYQTNEEVLKEWAKGTL